MQVEALMASESELGMRILLLLGEGAMVLTRPQGMTASPARVRGERKSVVAASTFTKAP